MRQSPTWAMRRRGEDDGTEEADKAGVMGDAKLEDDDDAEEEDGERDGVAEGERRSARSAVDDPSVPSARQSSSVRSYARWRMSTGSMSICDAGLAGRRGASTAAGVSSVGVCVGVGVGRELDEEVDVEEGDVDCGDDDVGGN